MLSEGDDTENPEAEFKVIGEFMRHCSLYRVVSRKDCALALRHSLPYPYTNSLISHLSCLSLAPAPAPLSRASDC